MMNLMKKLNIIMLLFVLSIAGIYSFNCNAATVEEDRAMGDDYCESSGENELSLFSASATAIPAAPASTVAKGVDLSYYDGTIDFSKLKNAVDFAIVRCGYGKNLTSQDDKQYENYIKGCRDNGIPYGVYLYSYATSVSDAKSEAQHAIRLLSKLKGWNTSMSIPFFYDMENSKQAAVSASLKGQIAQTFCSTLEEAGYHVGIYANAYWWKNYLTASYFNSVIKWVAEYKSSMTYTGSCAMWQCSESAAVSGISGVCDYNYMLSDISFNKIFTTNKKLSNTITASNISKTYTGASQTVSLNAGCQGGAALTYASSNSLLTVTTNGKVTIKSGFIGTAYITIHSAATSVYNAASKKISVTVSLGKTTLSSLKNVKGRKLLVKWKRNKTTTGYQIQYSTSSSFKSGNKTLKIKSNKTLSKTIKSLKKGKKYYVRIRSYKTISQKTYYSAWSAVKKLKISK